MSQQWVYLSCMIPLIIPYTNVPENLFGMREIQWVHQLDFNNPLFAVHASSRYRQ